MDEAWGVFSRALVSIRHVVRSGEHLSAIAARSGFRSDDTVWNAAENQALRGLRDPSMLLAGDIVELPDRDQRTEERDTGRRHTFFVNTSTLKLKLRILDALGEPIDNQNGELSIDGAKQRVQTDEAGVITVDIPRTAKGGSLTLGDLEYTLRIGGLAPPEEDTGLRARLTNLGYFGGDVADEDDGELRFAIELFQQDHGLPLTGCVNDSLKADVAREHGC
jgi:hypothetical protein